MYRVSWKAAKPTSSQRPPAVDISENKQWELVSTCYKHAVQLYRNSLTLFMHHSFEVQCVWRTELVCSGHHGTNILVTIDRWLL